MNVTSNKINHRNSDSDNLSVKIEWYDKFTEKSHESSQYLLYLVGDEYFATPTTNIQEVIEMVQIKEVPNTVENYKGVFTYRGSVIGALDMREQNSDLSDGRILILETEIGKLAAIVSDVKTVIYLTQNSIDTKPNLKVPVRKEYLVGVADLKENIVTIVNLPKILTTEEILTLKSLK